MRIGVRNRHVLMRAHGQLLVLLVSCYSALIVTHVRWGSHVFILNCLGLPSPRFAVSAAQRLVHIHRHVAADLTAHVICSLLFLLGCPQACVATVLRMLLLLTPRRCDGTLTIEQSFQPPN